MIKFLFYEISHLRKAQSMANAVTRLKTMLCHEFQQIRPLPLEKSLFYNLRSTDDGCYKKRNMINVIQILCDSTQYCTTLRLLPYFKFLRNMSTSKKIAIKKKVGKWVPFCCTLGGEVDLGLGITYEELCIIFLRPKKFYRHFKKNFPEKLKISVLKKTQNILKIKSCKENANLNNW
ncbi:hypothetical protein AGLY_015115 [Aphis glycines]|uniref:Uncharacterized protein n=1 Tax=Aphis glycines TaxID=307491 RepID=A0A6G0T1V2_APHGL|nr:hypothetical protein AGLY_015115 [Aphis glycines]